MAITQEDCISAHRAEKKRKTPTGPSNMQQPRYRLVQNTATRAVISKQSIRQMGSQASPAGSI
jgi:hypothetical protein